MSFAFPEFDTPTPLDAQRSWTARFDSYDQRNEDVYYRITVHGPGDATARFMVQLYPSWGDDWTAPQFAALLKEDLRRLAVVGKANTTYTGALVPRT